MARIPGYKHDIFISYAHDDNHALRGQNGWVDSFHEHLENALVRRLGRKELSIWRDTGRMHENTVFHDEIKEAVRDSALFFALMSSNYLNSTYCLEELAWFYEFGETRPGGLRVGNHLRIFNILLRNEQHENWPKALQGTQGFTMHDAAPTTDLGDPIEPYDSRFQTHIRRIADAVEYLVRDFPEYDPKPEENRADCLVDTHQKDQFHAFKLAEYLDMNGIDVDLTLESRNPSLSLQLFEQSVEQVKNLVIMCGKVSTVWLEKRIEKVLNVITSQYARQIPITLENIWVCLLPPDAGSNEGRADFTNFPPVLRIEILDNRFTDSIDPDVLGPLLNTINPNR